MVVRLDAGQALYRWRAGSGVVCPWSAGGIIVPNHAMGGANVVVNVDASGSSVEGDSTQATQLGKMLGHCSTSRDSQATTSWRSTRTLMATFLQSRQPTAFKKSQPNVRIVQFGSGYSHAPRSASIKTPRFIA